MAREWINQFLDNLADISYGHRLPDGTLDVRREIANKVPYIGLNSKKLGELGVRLACLKLAKLYPENLEIIKEMMSRTETLKDYVDFLDEDLGAQIQDFDSG